MGNFCNKEILPAEIFETHGFLWSGDADVPNQLRDSKVVFLDKTGVITQNLDMEVRRLYANMEILDVSEPNFCYDSTELEALRDAALLACDTGGFDPASKTNAEGQPLPVFSWVVKGTPTEASILKFFQRFDDVEALSARYELVVNVPFTSYTKMGARMLRIIGRSGYTVCAKGAPERLVSSCTAVLVKGESLPMTDERRNTILEDIKTMAAGGHRCLAIARREYGDRGDAPTVDLEQMTFVGAVGMIDPPRPDIALSVRRMREDLNLQVVALTGDHDKTNSTIASETNIITNEGRNARQYIGAQVPELRGDDWDRIVGDGTTEVIFSRVSPDQKAIILLEFAKRGSRGVFVGDGVNDAAAMRCDYTVGVCPPDAHEATKAEASLIYLRGGDWASALVNVFTCLKK